MYRKKVKVIKELTYRKAPNTDDFTGKFYQKHQRSDNPNDIYIVLVQRKRRETPTFFLQSKYNIDVYAC